MNAQKDQIIINEFENDKLIKALNNAEKLSENREKYLSVKIYRLDNGSGSGNSPTCEVSHNLLIATSGSGEAPEQHLFEISEFINPVFIKWENVSEYQKSFIIEYSSKEKRIRKQFEVRLDSLKFN